MVSVTIAVMIYLSTLFSPIQCNSQPINTYSGIGTSNTHTFQVESPWQLAWTSSGSGSFTIRANDPNSKSGLNLVSNDLKNGARHGQTIVYDIDGLLYLHVNSAVDTTWSVSIEK